jgi:hypothetical protein
MAYSKRKAIMFEQLIKTYMVNNEPNITAKEKRKIALDSVAWDHGVKVETVKRAERYARKVCLL